MKHEKTAAGAAAVLLGLALGWGCAGCLITAFPLPMEPWLPGLVCALTALVTALVLALPRGELLLVALLALAGTWLYRDGRAMLQLKLLVQRISEIYDSAYGWGSLYYPGLEGESFRPEWPVCILGALTALAVSHGICRRRPVWLSLLCTLLPLCSCIVVTDTVPGEPWLLVVMGGLILLILTSPARRENAAQGLRLMAAAALPVAAALTVLFLAVPQDSYVNRSGEFRDAALEAARRLPGLVESGLEQAAAGLTTAPGKQVDLAGLGPRVESQAGVMTVTAGTGGALYLRLQDYDRYTGLGWRASVNRRETFSGGEGETEQITIRNLVPAPLQALPYHPVPEVRLLGGAAEDTGTGPVRTLTWGHLPRDWRETACSGTGEIPAWDAYLELPQATRQQLEPVVEALIPAGSTPLETADRIAAFVTDSGVYVLDPGEMPENQQDFALWFLGSSRKGYCVHFATAAVVLLRTAGIPARYVTGYLVETIPGEPVTVTGKDAHAWAEYYEPNLGLWLPLEATPAREQSAGDLPAAAEQTLPGQTLPEQTLPQLTQPTQPVQTEATEAPATVPARAPEQTPAPEGSGVPGVLLWLWLVPAAAELQARLRKYLRRRRQRTGSPNRQALLRWRETERLSRLLREEAPEELLELARKARFSQHTLTEEELSLFDRHIRSAVRRIRKLPWWRQLLCRFVYAAY